MRRFIGYLMMLFTCVTLFSCDNSNSEKNSAQGEMLVINATSTTYDLEKNNSVILSVDEEKSILSSFRNIKSIQYTFSENTCNGYIYSNGADCYFSATSAGSAKIVAKLDSLVSNEIIIYASYSNNTIGQNILDIRIGMPFGHCFDVGLTKGKKYYIETYDADDNKNPDDEILKINENNEIEVVGIAVGALKLYDSMHNLIIETVYTVYNSTFTQRVVDSLLEKNIIHSENDSIYNSYLREIDNLDLSEIIVNYPDASRALKYFPNLKFLNLSNNNISDSDLNNLNIPTNHKLLEYLDLSNNLITDVSRFFNDATNMNKTIKYLDLSNNAVKNINMLGSLMNVETINLNNNEVSSLKPFSSCTKLINLYLDNNALETTDYADAFSALRKLKTLHINNCGLNDISLQSISRLASIEDLGLSGTDISLSLISELTSLKKLYLSDCDLSRKSLGEINKLTNLEYLDISNNGLSAESFNKMDIADSSNNLLDGNRLHNLKSLCIGNNEFEDFSFLQTFTSLEELDLSWSYNLTSISTLTGLNIKSLYLDNCNSLSSSGYIETISSLKSLEKLSIISSFNYLNKELYNQVIGLLQKNVKLRIIDEKNWIDKDTIKNYSSLIYFSFSDFLDNGTIKEDDGSYTLKYVEPNRCILLSLVNDLSTKTYNTDYVFNIPFSISKFVIYGNKYVNEGNGGYHFQFNIQNRKESSITLEIHDFVDSYLGNVIKGNMTGEKLKIVSYGKCTLRANNYSSKALKDCRGKNGYDCISAYDVSIYNNDLDSENTLFIYGSDGQSAVKASDYAIGQDGGAGGSGIKCNSCVIYSNNVQINGGSGGHGGDGGDATNNFIGMQVNEHGKDGGRGGAGGNGISYKTFVRIKKAVVNGGYGGLGGKGGNATGIGSSIGKTGQYGSAGYSISKY